MAELQRRSVTASRERLVELERRIRASMGAARALGYWRLADLLQERATVVADLLAGERTLPPRAVEAEIARGEHAVHVWESLACF